VGGGYEVRVGRRRDPKTRFIAVRVLQQILSGAHEVRIGHRGEQRAQGNEKYVQNFGLRGLKNRNHLEDVDNRCEYNIKIDVQ
jgi:hypothetical protein